jgi:hypothetical protein
MYINVFKNILRLSALGFLLDSRNDFVLRVKLEAGNHPSPHGTITQGVCRRRKRKISIQPLHMSLREKKIDENMQGICRRMWKPVESTVVFSGGLTLQLIAYTYDNEE